MELKKDKFEHTNIVSINFVWQKVKFPILFFRSIWSYTIWLILINSLGLLPSRFVKYIILHKRNIFHIFGVNSWREFFLDFIRTNREKMSTWRWTQWIKFQYICRAITKKNLWTIDAHWNIKNNLKVLYPTTQLNKDICLQAAKVTRKPPKFQESNLYLK